MYATRKEQQMTMTIRRVTLTAAAVSLALMAVLAAIAAGASEAAVVRHFDGTALSKNRQAQTFRADIEQRGPMRFHVNRRTEFERIPGGFSGLERGMRIEVDAKRTNHGWVARQVERDRDNR
jgi:hypothetical protein